MHLRRRHEITLTQFGGMFTIPVMSADNTGQQLRFVHNTKHILADAPFSKTERLVRPVSRQMAHKNFS